MPRRFRLGRHIKRQFRKNKTSSVSVKHVPVVEDSVLVPVVDLVAADSELAAGELAAGELAATGEGDMDYASGSSDSDELVVSAPLNAIEQSTHSALRNIIQDSSLLPKGKFIITIIIITITLPTADAFCLAM